MERRQVALQESLAFRSLRGSAQAVAWHLGRDCSASPRQLVLPYAGLSLVSLAIGIGFRMIGARLVRRLAGIELLALGAALLVYARRHAVGGETLSLQDDRVTVGQETAGIRQEMEFGCAHVRIACRHCDLPIAAGVRHPAGVDGDARRHPVAVEP